MTRYFIKDHPVEIDGRTILVDIDFNATPLGGIWEGYEIEDVTVFLSDAEKARLPIPFPVAIRHFEDRVEQLLYYDLKPLRDFAAAVRFDDADDDEEGATPTEANAEEVATSGLAEEDEILVPVPDTPPKPDPDFPNLTPEEWEEWDYMA